jgi:hypothetical protein
VTNKEPIAIVKAFQWRAGESNWRQFPQPPQAIQEENKLEAAEHPYQKLDNSQAAISATSTF